MFDYNNILNSQYMYDIKYINVNGNDNYKIRDLLTAFIKLEMAYGRLFTPDMKNLSATVKKRNDIYKEKCKKTEEFDKYLIKLLTQKHSILYLQDGITINFENGVVHSLDSPAIIYETHLVAYYINGEKLSYYDWNRNTLVRLAKLKKIQNID